MIVEGWYPRNEVQNASFSVIVVVAVCVVKMSEEMVLSA